MTATYAPLLKFVREIALGASDRHYREWHVGFDKNDEKHNDAGGGHSWSKCYCVEGRAREALDATTGKPKSSSREG